MIYRLLEKRLLEDLGYFPVVVLLGPRQVGKTTLAQTIRTQLPTESLYLDLELTTDMELLRNAESFLNSHADTCIILDEVQRKPDLFPLIRALVDQQRRPGRFLLLGSASPDLIKQSSDSLAGRVSYLELTPFALTEIKGEFTWQEHWLKGGFPIPLLTPSNRMAARWINNFIATFVERDLRGLGYQLTAPTLERFLRMLTTVHGNLLNLSDLARSMGQTHPTISHYLDLLEGGFLIHRLQPYFTNLTKRLVKSPKLYIRDSGILHRLARINTTDELQHHILIGASWEGYVIEQLRRTASETEFYFYRTQAGAECDLLVVLPDGRKACIEIKYADVPTLKKGFYVSLEDIGADFAYVITPNSRTYQLDKRITVMSLPNFMEHTWRLWMENYG